MPVRKDPSGQRSVEAEAEIPGTPEQVWAAIATGSGISSWFVPSTSEEKVDGIVTNNFGPGMESKAVIKQWNPPQSFIAESKDGGPVTVATEWIVEAKSGGTCTVRVVHRWFASNDDWDNQFEGHTHGWRAFFRILHLYCQYFTGQKCRSIQLSAFSTKALPDLWQSLMNSLPFQNNNTEIDQKVDSPHLSAIVERREDGAYPELLLRLNRPSPGIAHLFLLPMGPQIMVSLRFFLYGEQGTVVAESVEHEWSKWLKDTVSKS